VFVWFARAGATAITEQTMADWTAIMCLWLDGDTTISRMTSFQGFYVVVEPFVEMKLATNQTKALTLSSQKWKVRPKTLGRCPPQRVLGMPADAGHRLNCAGVQGKAGGKMEVVV
jgi:hypothetical protein